MIKIASLFSGIGGFETGFMQHFGEDTEIVFASEIDKFASKSYEMIYNHTPHGDITKIHETDIPDHDVMVYGFPCQAFSVAGKRMGFSDTRGTLFFEALRIINEKRPKVAIAENVKGLVGHDKGRTLEVIVQSLSEIGYRVDFEILNSKYFGVPQNRERIFIVAVRDDLVQQENWKIDSKRTDVLAKGKRKIASLPDIKTFNFDFPSQKTVTKRIKDILEPSVDEKYYLSKERVAKMKMREPKEGDIKVVADLNTDGYIDNSNRLYSTEGIAATVTRKASENQNILEPKVTVEATIEDGVLNNQNKRIYDKSGIAPTIDTMQGGMRQPKILEEPELDQVGYIERNSQGNRVYDSSGLASTVSASGGGLAGNTGLITEPSIDTVGQIEEWRQRGHVYNDTGLMGTVAATDYKTPKLVNETEKQAFVVNDYEIRLREDELATCLDTRYGAFPDQHGARTGIYEGDTPHLRIRKLTPLECLRLQGFPDDYHHTLKENGISDSQLYKMAGNAVSVPVIKAIAEKVDNLLRSIGKNEE